MEGFPPSSMEDWTQVDLQSLLLSPADNQDSILCNDQGGQNNVINDSIQQTTDQSPPSLPQTMPGHGYMTPNATTSQHGGFNQPGPSFPPPRYQPNPNLFDPQCANPMLPAPSMPLRDQQSTDYQLPMSNQVPAMLLIKLWQYICCRVLTQSQMDNLQVRGLQNQTATPNASNPGPDTSLQSQNRGLNTRQVEMGGSINSFRNYVEERADDGSMKCKFCPHTFANKTSISRIKWHLSGEGGHDVAICHGVPQEVQEAAWKAMCGGKKRHKITAGSINVNDCGISTMVGGIGRVQREAQPEVGEQGISSHAIAGNDAGSMTGMRAQEDRVSEGALESRLSTEPVDRSLEHSNAILGNLAGGAGRIQEGVQVMEQDPGEERIQSHLQAENGMENTGEGSFPHNAFETVPTTEQVQLPEPRGGSSQL